MVYNDDTSNNINNYKINKMTDLSLALVIATIFSLVVGVGSAIYSYKSFKELRWKFILGYTVAAFVIVLLINKITA